MASRATPLAPVQSTGQPIVAIDHSPLLVPATFDAMWRLAEAMARAKTLPEHLRGSPGDCLRVVEMAHRCGQSPFALADHCFVTGGKLAMDGQGMAALINASPKIAGNLRYEYAGQGAARECRVVGRLAGEAEPREVLVTLAQGLADSKGARSRWQSDGDQMLSYYGARKWARRHAPEITMGLYTADELRAGDEGGTPMIDVTPPSRGPADVGTDPGFDPISGEVYEQAREPEPAAQSRRTSIPILNERGREIGTAESYSRWWSLFAEWWQANRRGLTHAGNLAALDKLVEKMPDGDEREAARKVAADLREDLDAAAGEEA